MWKLKPLPAPHAHYDQLLDLLQQQVCQHVIELSCGLYTSRWFPVQKKGGIDLGFTACKWHHYLPLELVHLLDNYVNTFASRVIYSMPTCFLYMTNSNLG